jgi:hypothetical protein
MAIKHYSQAAVLEVLECLGIRARESGDGKAILKLWPDEELVEPGAHEGAEPRRACSNGL